jgi:hypothetical protein
MPGGLTLLASTNAAIPTPATGKVTIFFSTDSGVPSYKDDAGVVAPLGTTGATGAQGPMGPAIPMLYDNFSNENIILPNPQTNGPDFIKFAEVVLAADTATVSFTGIPTSYKHMLLIGNARNDNAAGGSTDGYMQFNGDTAANYYRNFLGFVNTTVNAGQTLATAKCPAFFIVNNGATAGLATSFNTFIYNYNGAFIKNATTAMICSSALSSGNILGNDDVFSWNSTAVINSILLGMTDTSKFKANSTFTLYLLR